MIAATMRPVSELDLVEGATILRGTVGSTAHGLHHGGQDDRDEMAVFLEPPEYQIGLAVARKEGVRRPFRFEHWVQRTQPEGARRGVLERCAGTPPFAFHSGPTDVSARVIP
jgi:hypothetical protein